MIRKRKAGGGQAKLQENFGGKGNRPGESGDPVNRGHGKSGFTVIRFVKL